MSLAIPEIIDPSVEMLSVFTKEDLDDNTQPAVFSEDLLEHRVAVATVYEHNQLLHYHGPVHIGRVSMINLTPNIAHLTQREKPVTTDTTFVMLESYNTFVALDPKKPNFTELLPVRALFYVLPQKSNHAV